MVIDHLYVKNLSKGGFEFSMDKNKAEKAQHMALDFNHFSSKGKQ